ncbi:MAG: hypothetical protein AAFZ65_07585 [Planctomycetota bacterium]
MSTTEEGSTAPRLAAVWEAVLGEAGRTPLPGALSVVATAPEDDPADVAALLEAGGVRVPLARRGIDHGAWIVLPETLSASAPLPRPSHLRRRWREARPWVWRDAVTDELRLDRNRIHGGLRLHGQLGQPGGLESLLRARLGGRGQRFGVLGPKTELADPERDLACVGLGDERFDDLWAKVGRLSTHPEDQSLRLRFSFGEERLDDASRDVARHRAVSALTEAVLPEARLAGRKSALLERISEWRGERLWTTQGIAYWNAPQGGARFHHDAFEDHDDPQRGVLYVQLAGQTAWLALSILDLARRVVEFVDGVDPDDPILEAVEGEFEDERDLVAELALPGCGRLGPLVDDDPRFTAWLADCGHAAVLDAGDAIVLPNLGRAATAMHSVFCASAQPTYALSFALRANA